MPLTEILILEIGPEIAKSILRLWLKDSSIAGDVSSTLVDLLKSRTSDLIAQRRGERQFEEIGENVAQSLMPIFEMEGARFDEGTCISIAHIVAESFNQTAITSELLAENNLDPYRLARHILDDNHAALRDFSNEESAFYRRIIEEACRYIVKIGSSLPAFSESSFAEVLKREDLLLNISRQILEELRTIREQLDPRIEAERFEIEYRESVVRSLDVLQLTGTDLSIANRRNRLSVAYITLSVLRKSTPVRGVVTMTKARPEEINREIVPADAALAGARHLLIRGQAGSGKSTLLQWIAVKAASRSFDGPLSAWNKLVPFYLRLRQYVKDGLPGPEKFPSEVARAIFDTMPKGWVHNQLKAGNGIVLVDGLDEIAANQRDNVHDWLVDLMETYRDVRFIITSRPHVLEEGWLINEGLEDAELQPMSLADINLFIDHWHQAVQQNLQVEAEKADLLPLAEKMKERVRHTQSIRALATVPLLCAMLCALNRERMQHLPDNRIELYRACSSLLLERRDKDRNVDLSDYASLTLDQKQRLLNDLAYWMIQDNLSEAPAAAVDDHFANKLAEMPNISPDITGSRIRKVFVERAGVIREPVLGQIDFTHRTFQEFYAAQQVLDLMEINQLIQHAGDDNWREVIILAAGLASKLLCEQLISGLIARGDNERANRYKLHLLAVSCMETAIEIRKDLRQEVEKRLSKLVPPKNMTAAKALSSAGEMAVKYLTRRENMPATTSAACVRTLALIGGENALDTLIPYASDTSLTVVSELVKAWDSFERESYARLILSQVYQGKSSLQLERLTSLDGIQYFTDLEELNLTGCDQLARFSPLAALKSLTHLNLAGCEKATDLSPLSGLSRLTQLDLTGCRQLNSLEFLAGTREISVLDLANCKQISDFCPIENLSNLVELDLTFCDRLVDLSFLTDLNRLQKLYMPFCEQVSDLKPLLPLSQLVELDLAGCRRVDGLDSLAGLGQLKWLSLAGCDLVHNLRPLADMKALDELDLAGCARVSDLGPLKSLSNITSLNLALCHEISDLSPLANFTHLVELDLAGCSGVTDLSPLAHLPNLARLNLAGCEQIEDLRPLAGLSQISDLDLAGCTRIRNVEPLAGLSHLTNLDLAACAGIKNLKGLYQIKSLKRLGLQDVKEPEPALKNTGNNLQITTDRLGFGKWILSAKQHTSLNKVERRNRSYEFIAYTHG